MVEGTRLRSTALRAYLRRGLGEVFVGTGPGVDESLSSRAVVLASHQAPWDSAIALNLSWSRAAEFRHLAAQHVLQQNSWLRRLGFFDLSEQGTAFDRIKEIETFAQGLRTSNRLHVWLMPVQGHWRTRESASYSSVGSLFMRAMGESSVVLCTISYVMFGVRRPIALVWLEALDVERPEDLRAPRVAQAMEACDAAGWAYFRGSGPVASLLRPDTLVLVEAMPVRVGLVERAARQSTGGRVGTSSKDGRLVFTESFDSSELKRFEREVSSYFGPNLTSSIMPLAGGLG